eukprot:9472464-Pyramimonas_sp.AAC.2
MFPRRVVIISPRSSQSPHLGTYAASALVDERGRITIRSIVFATRSCDRHLVVDTIFHLATAPVVYY